MENTVPFDQVKHYKELSYSDRLIAKIAVKIHNIIPQIIEEENKFRISNDTILELNRILFPENESTSEEIGGLGFKWEDRPKLNLKGKFKGKSKLEFTVNEENERFFIENADEIDKINNSNSPK